MARIFRSHAPLLRALRPCLHPRFHNSITQPSPLYTLPFSFPCQTGSNLQIHLLRRSFSTRSDVAHEEEALAALRRVAGAGGKDVVRLGLVKNLRVDVASGVVRFQFMSNDALLQQRCVEALQRLHWIKQMPVIERGQPLVQSSSGITRNVAEVERHSDVTVTGLDKVKHIVAVSSCKGGVGKSTVAVNLACALQRLGHVVGLVDADIYGPSLPRMMVTDQGEWAVARSEDGRMIRPVELHDVRCMSYGFVAPGSGGRGTPGTAKGLESNAAMLRGPMVSSIVSQLCTKTMWGDIDYLVVDMPPGTGDIHLTLCQELKKIDAAVIVTTPQQLSFVDVVKGIDMFMQLKVPTVAVVENMSYFVGDDDKVYKPFGDGHVDTLKQRYGIKHSYGLPISRDTSSAGDSGVPYLRQFPNAPLSSTYMDMAQGVVDEVEALQSAASSALTCKVSYSEGRGGIVVRIFEDEVAKEYLLDPKEFRSKLNTVDAMLNVDADTLADDIRPIDIQPKGSYAVSITWSDGHDASIYPFDDIRQLCEASSS